MKNKIIIYLLFLGFLTFSCKEKNEIVYDPYPLNLTVDHFLNLNHLRWNKIESSDFVSYTLWRSIGNDTIPNEPTTLATATVVTAGGLNQNSTEFTHNVIASVSLPTFYRIQMNLKNRSIWSRNVKVENKPIATLDNSFKITVMDSVNQKIFMVDHASKKVAVYDIKQNKITRSKSVNLISSLYSTAKLGVLDNKKELYISSNDSLFVLDSETLNRVAQYNFDSTILSIDTDNNGKIFISQRYGDFKIIDRRKNKEVFSSKIGTSSDEYRCFYVQNQNKLLKIQGFSPYKASLITLNSGSDAFLSESPSKELNDISILGTNLSVSNWDNVRIFDNNHFFIGAYIFTFDMVFVSRLSSSSINRLYIDKKTGVIYTITNNFVIAQYNFPSSFIKQVSLSGRSVEQILYAKGNNELIILLTNTSTLVSEIDKMKI